MSYTVVSFASAPAVADMHLRVYSHHASNFEAAVALDQHVERYVKRENADQNYHEREQVFSTCQEDWKAFPNCFYATASLNHQLDGDDNLARVEVWHKTTKPGRVYGETPKRRLVQTFQIVQDEPVAPANPPASPVSPEKTSDVSPPSYDSVVTELKKYLANRREPAAPKAPTFLKSRRLSQVKEQLAAQTRPVVDDNWVPKSFLEGHIHHNPLWQRDTPVAEDDDDSFSSVDTWSSSSEEEYYQRAPRQSVPRQSVTDQTVDQYFSNSNDLHCPDEWPEVTFNWPDLTVDPVPHSPEEHQGVDAIEEFLQSYQQVVNDWRSERGLPNEMELSEQAAASAWYFPPKRKRIW